MLRFFFFAAKQGTSVHKYDRGSYFFINIKQIRCSGRTVILENQDSIILLHVLIDKI